MPAPPIYNAVYSTTVAMVPYCSYCNHVQYRECTAGRETFSEMPLHHRLGEHVERLCARSLCNGRECRHTCCRARPGPPPDPFLCSSVAPGLASHHIRDICRAEHLRPWGGSNEQRQPPLQRGNDTHQEQSKVKFSSLGSTQRRLFWRKNRNAEAEITALKQRHATRQKEAA